LNNVLESFKFPNDILNTRLYLTCYDTVKDWLTIRSTGISHIINATAECCNLYEKEGIDYFEQSLFLRHKIFETRYFG
jgi:hypothetical protein